MTAGSTTANAPWWLAGPARAAPVLALLSLPDGTVLAGGPGGVARRDAGDGWQPISVRVGAVAALAVAGSVVVAGGAEGIAWSPDEGRSWRRAEIEGSAAPVTDLASAGSTILAATVGGGILRSDNAGRSWRPAGYGLASPDVNVVVWTAGESVLAGTDAGLHVSPNGGRAWRPVPGMPKVPIVGITHLDDGEFLAVGSEGELFATSGRAWQQVGAIPAIPNSVNAILSPSPGVVLIGTTTGAVRSTDNGKSWQDITSGGITCIGSSGETVLAGTESGLIQSPDGGENWLPADAPPVNDLAHLVVVDDDVLGYGPIAALVRFRADEDLPVPTPLAVVAPEPSGGLLSSSPDGLARSTDGGRTWASLVDGDSGLVHVVAFGPDGAGWAASRDGTRLLHTTDSGVTWEPAEPAWGAGIVLALSAIGDAVLVATYDPSSNAADLWRMANPDGQWRHASRTSAGQPSVALCAEPPVAVVASTWLYGGEAGAWHRGHGPPGTIRYLAGQGHSLLAATDKVVAFSSDRGNSWAELADIPSAEILDVAVTQSHAYVLRLGGELWARSTPTPI